MNTITETERNAASDRATDYFDNGFHCAEAVAAAVLEAVGEDPSEAAAHATAFGGGFGRTFGEACGALSGALIAIGHLHGRRKPGGSWDLPAKLGAEIRQRFIDDFGTAHCAKLRTRFGKERQMAECRNVVKKVTVALLELVTEDPSKHEASCCERPADSPNFQVAESG
jgi:C_GCAxxG_C_C family probable redox protein